MTPRELVDAVQLAFEPMFAREIAGIAAIDTAIPHATPDYVVMLHDVKTSKQANVEQLATMVRMHGRTPDERGGLRKTLTRTQVATTSRVSVTLTLRAMRTAELELVELYSEAGSRAQGLVRTGLQKARGRAMIHAYVLTAHLAKRTGSSADVDRLSAPLDAHFAGDEPRACMRCHLDRPGSAAALERVDPHPYTYICAACHDEVLQEFSPDLAEQMDRWPAAVRDAKVMQKAMGRVSKLNAIGRVLRPLAGLEPDVPVPASERDIAMPPATPTPGPAPGERLGVLIVQPGDEPESAYVTDLFSASRTWRNW